MNNKLTITPSLKTITFGEKFTIFHCYKTALFMPLSSIIDILFKAKKMLKLTQNMSKKKGYSFILSPIAVHSISINAPIGKSFTASATLAGYSSVKYFE